jgi:hypothetical protein
MRRLRDEAGSATVLVLAMAGVLVLIGAALGTVAAMVQAHRLAQSGADLAALAVPRASPVAGTDAARRAGSPRPTTSTSTRVGWRVVRCW